MVRAILTAPVDLLYNGGIGTYVKASAEEHVDVGDRANDRVRVDAKDVRARVVGEGGNLGFTQKARLEYWDNGGLINTDAVDNSGGVDMSDHEVNIKILMDVLIKKGELNARDRDAMLMEMTEEVATLVLHDNADQALALTLDGKRSEARYEAFVDLVYELIASGVMDRLGNDVPSRRELLDSPNRLRGLKRPLLALVLGHVKIWAFSRILETDFPDSAQGRPFLESYFPRKLQRYSESLGAHPLRREIVATAAANHVVNHAGVELLWSKMKDTGASIGEIVKAYLECSLKAKARETREEISSSSGSAPELLTSLLELEDGLESATRSELTGRDKPRVLAGRRKAARG
jgi:glutamate dehydrogenase